MAKYKDAEWLRRMYWEEDKSTYEMAEVVDTTAGTISYWMDKHGIEKRDRTEAVKKAVGVNYAQFRVNDKGYEHWVASVGDGKQKTVYVARLLAVSEHGFEAVADKEVHHKNGIPWDNRPENLEALTVESHVRHHNNEQFSDAEGVESNFAGSKDLDWITEDMVRELYHGEGMSQSEVADELGVSRKVIRNRMDWWDIEARGKEEGHQLKYN